MKITVQFDVSGMVKSKNYFATYLAEMLEIPQEDGEPFLITDVYVHEITED